MHNVYRIDSGLYYTGISLVAADNVDEANQIIKSFKDEDKSNLLDSYGYEYVSEDNMMDGIFSERKGIILSGIYYSYR